MSPERQERNRKATKEMLAALPLTDLRMARDMTQVRLAELLETSQSEVSRIEKRSDMYVSTLRSYIEALGGKLEIIAHFPDGTVQISQFGVSSERDESEALLRAAAAGGR
jgi:transcriptional regulator with XRE-family HTH domain